MTIVPNQPFSVSILFVFGYNANAQLWIPVLRCGPSQPEANPEVAAFR
jgi:hypothetical protein